jgi:hypothetical protein
MLNRDIVNVFIKKCLNLKFRHFNQQNKCAINHYSLQNDSVILFWFLIELTRPIIELK